MKELDGIDIDLGRELDELFRPRRPDASAFRDGVRRRIAEKLRAREREDVASDAAPRRAAGSLPLDPFALGAVATAGAKGAMKVAGTVALPIALLAASVASFVFGLRSIARSLRGERSGPPAPVRSKGSWLHREPGPTATYMVAYALPIVGAMVPGLANRTGDLVLAVTLLAMAATIVGVRELARSGVWSRADMARLGASTLWAIYGGSYLLVPSMAPADLVSELGIGWCGTVVASGIVGCSMAAAALNGRVLSGIAQTAGIAALVFALTPPGWRVTGDELRRDVERFDAYPGALAHWEAVAARVDALRAAGEELPALERLERRIAEAIESESDAHPVVWKSAARMGRIDGERWKRFAARRLERHALEQLVSRDGPIAALAMNEHVIPMFLAASDPTSDEIDHVARRVLASWPEPGSVGSLATATSCVRALDLLGRSAEADALRERAHRLLSAGWVSGERPRFGAQIGGFTSVEEIRSSMPDATWHAIELVSRFGAPDGIDLRAVRGHLRRLRGNRLFSWLDREDQSAAYDEASLFRLEREIGLPERSGWRALLAERLLVASILLVLLCWSGVALARPDHLEGDGALP